MCPSASTARFSVCGPNNGASCARSVLRLAVMSALWFECEDAEGETLPEVQQLAGDSQARKMSTMVYQMSCIVYNAPQFTTT